MKMLYLYQAINILKVFDTHTDSIWYKGGVTTPRELITVVGLSRFEDIRKIHISFYNSRGYHIRGTVATMLKDCLGITEYVGRKKARNYK